jgi:hypothetical protein
MIFIWPIAVEGMPRSGAKPSISAPAGGFDGPFGHLGATAGHGHAHPGRDRSLRKYWRPSAFSYKASPALAALGAGAENSRTIKI